MNPRMTLEEKINMGMIQVAGLWKSAKKDKNGNEFYTGNFGNNGVLFLFKNKDKTSEDNKPEFQLCLGERQVK